jgi:hypothetical protein
MDELNLTVTQIAGLVNRLSTEDKRTLLNSIDVDVEIYMDLVEDHGLLMAAEETKGGDFYNLDEAKSQLQSTYSKYL